MKTVSFKSIRTMSLRSSSSINIPEVLSCVYTRLMVTLFSVAVKTPAITVIQAITPEFTEQRSKLFVSLLEQLYFWNVLVVLYLSYINRVGVNVFLKLDEINLFSIFLSVFLSLSLSLLLVHPPLLTIFQVSNSFNRKDLRIKLANE